MSIDQTDVIDFVGIDPTSGDVILTVSDHLQWGTAIDGHIEALEAKLQRYLDFVGSGQLLEEYPTSAGRSLRIEIALKYPPDEQGQEWLESARAMMDGYGYHLSWYLPDLRR